MAPPRSGPATQQPDPSHVSAREAGSSLPAAERSSERTRLEAAGAPQAERAPLRGSAIAGDCPAASVLLVFAEATISTPLSRAPSGDVRCRRQCILRLRASRGRATCCGRDGHELHRRAIHPRRVAGEGSGGRDALPDPSRSGGRGRCRRRPAERRPQEGARQTRRVCESAPFSPSGSAGTRHAGSVRPLLAAFALDARGSARRGSAATLRISISRHPTPSERDG